MLIAALRRTGSTLASEALTELPRAFIFREPRVFLGHVQLKPEDLDRLHEVETGALAGTPRAGTSDPAMAVRWFLDRVVMQLSPVVEQVGIKEIRYGPGWRAALEEMARIAPVRVVALGRDPRDIYLSLAEQARVRQIHLPGPFGPHAVAEDLQHEFAVQRALIHATGAHMVRYEDLCRDPSAVRDLRAFVDSPVIGDGAIGMFKDSHRIVHGRDITELRVERWRRETDAELAAGAHETMERLDDYCRFWGYA